MLRYATFGVAVSSLLLTSSANPDPPRAKKEPTGKGQVKPRVTLRGQHGIVFCLQFSPDGKHLVAGSADGTVTLWDTSSGTKQLTWRAHRAPVISLCFSPDGKSLATADDTTLKVWDKETRRLRLTLPGHGNTLSGGIRGIAFSPTGRYLASAGRQKDLTGEVLLRDARTGRPVAALRGPRVGESNLVFTPDGRRLATAGREGGPAVWELASGSTALCVEGKSPRIPVENVALSPDGRRLAGSDSDVESLVRVWSLPSGKQALALAGHKGEVARVAFSPCGTKLASAGLHVIDNGRGGDLAGEVIVWEAAAGQRRLSLPFRVGEPAFCLAWAPDGSLATGHSDGTVKVWSVNQLLGEARSSR